MQRSFPPIATKQYLRIPSAVQNVYWRSLSATPSLDDVRGKSRFPDRNDTSRSFFSCGFLFCLEPSMVVHLRPYRKHTASRRSSVPAHRGVTRSSVFAHTGVNRADTPVPPRPPKWSRHQSGVGPPGLGEQELEAVLYEERHRGPMACCFLSQPLHHGIVDVELRLHAEAVSCQKEAHCTAAICTAVDTKDDRWEAGVPGSVLSRCRQFHAGASHADCPLIGNRVSGTTIPSAVTLSVARCACLTSRVRLHMMP